MLNLYRVRYYLSGQRNQATATAVAEKVPETSIRKDVNVVAVEPALSTDDQEVKVNPCVAPDGLPTGQERCSLCQKLCSVYWTCVECRRRSRSQELQARQDAKDQVFAERGEYNYVECRQCAHTNLPKQRFWDGLSSIRAGHTSWSTPQDPEEEDASTTTSMWQ